MPGQPITIRFATGLDAAKLAAMHVMSWRETYPGILSDARLASLSVSDRTEMWRRVIGDPAAHHATTLHIADCGGEIVGFGACGSQRSQGLGELDYDGEISAIYVLRAWQRRGVGTSLLGIMAADLINRGFRAVSLWVLQDNAPARRFYEHYGADLVSEEQRQPGVRFEVAYGWPDLRTLQEITAKPTGDARALLARMQN